MVTPAAISSLGGNRTTAVRWQRLLNELGHATEVVQSWEGGETDLLIALHARKSFDSIQRFAAERPDAPLVVVLTGTDLYRDLGRSDEVTKALGSATTLAATAALAAPQRPLEAFYREAPNTPPDLTAVTGDGREITLSSAAIADLNTRLRGVSCSPATRDTTRRGRSSIPTSTSTQR